MRSLLSLPVAGFLIFAVVMPARAVPPTVTPSPGYDARLAEQRRAAQSAPPVRIEKPPRRRSVIRQRRAR